MEKIFVSGNTLIVVKTNMLKDGKCYFGEKDIQKTLNRIVGPTDSDITDELMVMKVWNELKKEGIAPLKICRHALNYTGARMTELSKQRCL